MTPDPLNVHSHFLGLVDDILLSLIKNLLNGDINGALDALALSLVCKRLRRLTCSLIFRDVRWPLQGRVDFYPPPLWPYIRRLSFVQTQWVSQHSKSLDTLSKILYQLPNLTTFNYAAHTFSPTLSFVSTLATVSATLSTLEFTTVFFSHDALTLFTQYSGIHHLLIRQPDRSTLLSASEPKRLMSIQCVSNLVLACQSSLNHLELPGEFFPMELFISGSISFPRLKTLILRDYPPLEPVQFPMWKALRSTPRLRRLEVLCRLRVIGANAHRYALVPQDVHLALDEPSLFPSDLEILTISNPSLNDHIFRWLPSSLVSLFLDFIPDWENMLSSKDALAYHRPAVMEVFLSRMQRTYAPLGLNNLEELCIKMGWCATPEILGCVSQIFPNLKFLEFQGLRYVDRATEPESDVESCIPRLLHLHSLRVLKLALELREDSYEYSADGGVRDVGSVDQSAQKWAEAFAHWLPGLKMVAFEMRPHTGRSLGPRVLIGRPSWAWFSRGEMDSMNRMEGLPDRLSERQGSSRWNLPQAPPPDWDKSPSMFST